MQSVSDKVYKQAVSMFYKSFFVYIEDYLLIMQLLIICDLQEERFSICSAYCSSFFVIHFNPNILSFSSKIFIFAQLCITNFFWPSHSHSHIAT